jgi:putative alpha-1,2-mannosidase
MLAMVLPWFPAPAAQAAFDPALLVDPRVGTAAEGQTFPAVGMPFAMTNWTPETETGERKCVPPYLDSDATITGFRASHFMSGSCTQDYGSVTFVPQTGQLRAVPAAWAVPLHHADEQQHPYFYGVDLPSEHVRAELTATVHDGFLRFHFPSGVASRVLIHLNGLPKDATLQVDAAHRMVLGSSLVRRIYAGQGRSAGYRCYFVAEFDQPFASVGRSADGATAWVNMAPTRTDAWVQLRVGESFVSLEEARRNLRAEIPGWNFTATEQAVHAAWTQALQRVLIESHGIESNRVGSNGIESNGIESSGSNGKAPQRRIFYTALYHSLLLPRTVSDDDGSYPAFDGNAQTEHAEGFVYYDDFSLWDTYRAVHPLFTLLEPQRDSDMVRSLIAKGQQGGFLPIYPAWNSYTAEMTGDDADLVIADAWCKGLRGFPAEAAYALMRHNAMVPATPAEALNGEGRRALASYLRLGYIPLEDHIPDAFHHNEQVSRTLEYADDDWAVGEMAAALGHTADAALFARRSQNWRHVFDPSIGFVRGRHANGSWEAPFDPVKPDPAVTEGVPWQYTFAVPQDIDGLRQALGGPAALGRKLDGLFAHGLYDQGNEPSHTLAYLYDDAGEPWKAQAEIRRILDTEYKDTPDGLPGNDDAGQMSAWYVFSALGFYPVTPGTPRYALGTPRFDRVVFTPPAGKPLTILAEGAEEGMRYIRSVRLNGVMLHRQWLTQSELTGGGTLVFTMAAQAQL